MKRLATAVASLLLLVGLLSACEQEIIQAIEAGLSDPEAVEPLGVTSLEITEDNTTMEDFSIDGGTIQINADNVTLRNFYVRGTSNTSVVKIEEGSVGTVIENCEVLIEPQASGKNSRGIGWLGTSTTVRQCYVHGEGGDGIKVESGTATNPSVYEKNHVHVGKTAASGSVHLDAMQASADSHYIIKNNVLIAPKNEGGNAALFIQSWAAPQIGNVLVEDVVVEGNVLRGGNYTFFNEGGKCNTNHSDDGVPDCGDPANSPVPCDQPGDEPGVTYEEKQGNGVPDCWTLENLWVDDMLVKDNMIMDTIPGGTSGVGGQHEQTGGWRHGPFHWICGPGVTYTNNVTVEEANNSQVDSLSAC